MGKPFFRVDPMSIVQDTAGDSGDNTLIAAPGAGKRLVLVNGLVQNVSGSESIFQLKTATADGPKQVLVDNGAMTFSFAEGSEWRLPINEALVGNIDDALDHYYWFQYFVEVISL